MSDLEQLSPALLDFVSSASIYTSSAIPRDKKRTIDEVEGETEVGLGSSKNFGVGSSSGGRREEDGEAENPAAKKQKKSNNNKNKRG